MMPETTTAIKGQAGGLALAQKYGQEHMRGIGKLGGHPRASTIHTYIDRYIASAAQVKKERNGKGLKELLRLWKQQQACSAIITQGQACCHPEAAGRETRTGVNLTPGFSPSRVGLAVIGIPSSLLVKECKQ